MTDVVPNQEPDQKPGPELNRDQLINRILRTTNTPNLLAVLAEQLTPTDLQSLLLEVYRLRAARVAPAALLAQHEQNRFARPAATDPQVLLEFDRLAFAAANPPFTPIELAPVTPLGANSVVALVDQNKAVATSRNTEVVSDSTNVLALECAVRRRAHLRTLGRENELVRLCASHRLLRAQSYGDPLALAHFRLFALCTAGRDQGSFQFELSALYEQLGVCLRLLNSVTEAGYRIARLRVAVTDLTAGRQEGALRSAVVEPLAAEFPAVEIGFDPDRPDGRTYYMSTCFHIFAADDAGQEYQVGDGGFTTWTQRLLSNAKERLLISGLGTERLCAIFAV
jgi:hypothetical protein